MNLLSSKESESKAGGLNILGSLCGLSYDFSDTGTTAAAIAGGVPSRISENMAFFKKNSDFVSLAIWQLVFEL
jgi:hypothetical protein